MQCYGIRSFQKYFDMIVKLQFGALDSAFEPRATGFPLLNTQTLDVQPDCGCQKVFYIEHVQYKHAKKVVTISILTYI